MTNLMEPGKIVCFYSGGIKSLAALWNILADEQYKDYAIQVHHVTIINHTGKFREAAEKVRQTLVKIRAECSRKLIITENQVNFSCLPAPSRLPSDIDICAFVAAQMVNTDPSIRYVVMGFSNEDSHNSSNGNAVKRVQAYLAMTKQNPESALNAEYLFPLVTKSRSQILELLPVWNGDY